MPRPDGNAHEHPERRTAGPGSFPARMLILHASVGSGHEHAARSLAGAFHRLPGCEVRMDDTLAFAPPMFRDVYAGSYLETVARAPGLWQRYFETTNLTDPQRIASSNLSRGQAEKPLLAPLERLVNRFAPSAIVCTHFLPAEVLARRKHGVNPPIYTVVTDHVAHSFWQTPGVDGYFVASETPRNQLIARGVPGAAIRIRGIPVALEISAPKDPAQVRIDHGWAPDRPLVSLLGGGLPLTHARRIAEDLLALERPATLVVVAGRNTDLPLALADLADGPQVRLKVLGAIDYVDDLVAASDLVITKPGGLIASEVLARGTPLLVIDPIPGQEEWNADYLASVGAGVQIPRFEMVAHSVRRLLAEPSRLATMRERAREVGRPRAALDIAEDILRDLAGRRVLVRGHRNW